MASFYPITIEIDGRRCSGEWCLRQGGRITVGGFYGAKTVELGEAKPEDAAAKVLRELVKAWGTKEATARRTQAANLKRLTRRRRSR